MVLKFKCADKAQYTIYSILLFSWMHITVVAAGPDDFQSLKELLKRISSEEIHAAVIAMSCVSLNANLF